MNKETLDRLLLYNPTTGLFTWLQDRPPFVKAGHVAGWVEAGGYVCIRINSIAYKAHILAWLTTTGKMPTHELDHIDGCRTNNAILNLRAATRSENMCNAMTANDPYGMRGISLKNGKWRVRVQKDGKRHIIGSYDTISEAQLAATSARREIHGEFYYGK